MSKEYKMTFIGLAIAGLVFWAGHTAGYEKGITRGEDDAIKVIHEHLNPRPLENDEGWNHWEWNIIERYEGK